MPERIGRFELVRTLGAGGMGVVYLAVDAELDRKVAIKVLADRRIGEDDRLRMHREAQALARISHPNVVQVYEVGHHDGRLFVAMEYLDGSTLRPWLAEARPWQSTIDVLIQAGRGLAAAHAAGLIHRDFKPENVMLANDGRPRVLDFGLARLDAAHVDAVSDGGSEARVGATGDHESRASSSSRALHVDVTRTGATVGTPAYMAPEQFLGHALDARTDQFSFCVVLFEALYGRRPFGGRTRMQIAAAVTRGVVEVPAGARVPAWLRKIVLRGLSVEPRDRFADLDALVAALGRRSRVGRWAAGLTIAGGLALGAVVLRDDTPEPCSAVAAAIDGVWNQDARASIRAAFAAVERPWADDAFGTVEQSLDAWVERWRSARTDACVATLVEQTQSAELMDLRMACLDDRRRQLSALLDVLGAADAAVVQRAVAAVDGLPHVEPCAEPEYVRPLVPRPDDPAAQAIIEQLEERIAATRAEIAAGRYVAAVERLDGAADDARAVAYEPILGRLLLAQSRAHDAAGNHEAAEAASREAYLVALRVGERETAFGAALQHAETLGTFHQRREPAEQWLGFADAFARRPDADPFDAVDVASHRGTMLNLLGEPDAAIEQLVSALSRATELLAPDDLRLAQLHAILGKSYELRDRFDDARAQYESSLAIVRGRLGAQHPRVGKAMFDLGTLAVTRGDYDEALAHYLRAREVMTAALPAGHPSLAAVTHNLADVLGRLGRYGEAIDEQREALAAFEAMHGEDHTNVAFAYNNLGTLLRRLGRSDEALVALERSLAIRRRIYPADHPEIGLVLGNLALVMQDLRRFEEARVYQEQALTLARKELGTDHTLIATHLQNLGNTLEDLQRVDEAEQRFVEARGIWARLGVAEHPDAASAEQGLARIFRIKGRLDEALAAIERAIEIRSVLGEHPHLGADLHYLGEILLDRGEPERAIEPLRRAVAIPPAANDGDPERTLAGRHFDLARALAASPEGRAEAQALAERARAGFIKAGDEDRRAQADALLASLRR
jgi:tetratricopeptide (TPR) repeat protein/predicted Ser/Thr protein kinase